MERTPSEPFRILFVCTGNVCRSPYAQMHTRFLLEARLGPRAGCFAIASTGVGAVAGAEMHPSSRAQLASRRDDPAVRRFRARPLSEAEVAAADLVLTMSRRQRSRVLTDVPSARRRTFALREFARLLDVVEVDGLPTAPDDRARALVTAAATVRDICAPVPAEDDAVVDPITGGAGAHVDLARVIDAAVRRILGAIVVPHPALRPPSPAIPSPRSRTDAAAPEPGTTGLASVPAPRTSIESGAGSDPAASTGPRPRAFVALTARPRPVRPHR